MSDTRIEILKPVGAPASIDMSAGAGAALSASEAREKATVFVAAELAHRYPRDEGVSFAHIKQACENPIFAEGAEYRYTRGKGEKKRDIVGPTADFMRELARSWGNVRYGFDIVATTGHRVRIVGWAWDLNPGQNTFVTCPAEFAVMHQRFNADTGMTEWVEPDERDVRELINKQGSICERNALKKIMPSHVVDAATEICRETLTKRAAKEAVNVQSAVIKLKGAFAEYDISIDRIEAKLGHKLEACTPKEIDELRSIYRAMKSGDVDATDAFPVIKPEPAAESVQASDPLAGVSDVPFPTAEEAKKEKKK